MLQTDSPDGAFTYSETKAAHEHSGLCVFAFDAAHVVAAGGFAVDVHVLQDIGKRKDHIYTSPSPLRSLAKSIR